MSNDQTIEAGPTSVFIAAADAVRKAHIEGITREDPLSQAPAPSRGGLDEHLARVGGAKAVAEVFPFALTSG